MRVSISNVNKCMTEVAYTTHLIVYVYIYNNVLSSPKYYS